MGTSQSQWQAMLRDAESDLEEARGDLAALQRKVTNLGSIVNGLRGLLDLPHFAPGANIRNAEESVEAGRARIDALLRKVGDQGVQQLIRRPMRPRDAVLNVLARHPGTAMLPREVVELVREADLFNENLKSGANSYTTALNRLADDPESEVSRDAGGRYVFLPRNTDRADQLTGPGPLETGDQQ